VLCAVRQISETCDERSQITRIRITNVRPPRQPSQVKRSQQVKAVRSHQDGDNGMRRDKPSSLSIHFGSARKCLNKYLNQMSLILMTVIYLRRPSTVNSTLSLSLGDISILAQKTNLKCMHINKSQIKGSKSSSSSPFLFIALFYRNSHVHVALCLSRTLSLV
jgi:hypothetical protein